ncbi:aminotransferase class IV [Gammaproteobacteria bacterium]|nr:aminotransferase class IV [Gammaproteobacteria bacterium]
MDQIYLNGSFLPRSEAQIPIMDRGFLFGDGVYELIPVFNKKIFLLEEHLKRLKSSLNLIQMNDIKGLDKIISTLIKKNTKNTFFIYLHITRGVQSSRNHIYSENIEPTILLMCEDYPAFPKDSIRKGFQATIQNDFRWMKSNIKSISLLGNVLLKNYASSNECYETLLIRDNRLTEGSTSNVFIVKDEVIYTPKLSNELLPGVTRGLLIKLLGQNNLKVIESDISQSDLINADEVWCSSSTNSVVPIIKVDKNIINDGKAGKISIKAYEIAQDFISDF